MHRKRTPDSARPANRRPLPRVRRRRRHRRRGRARRATAVPGRAVGCRGPRPHAPDPATTPRPPREPSGAARRGSLAGAAARRRSRLPGCHL
ncbi:MAG: hypothetical protein DCC57_22755 [Chloroflexi bacterium]|nr:MAG: hypothetical protein DCC57_22755 [Chloroflexota bacterium]